jgi:hypothetical protein
MKQTFNSSNFTQLPEDASVLYVSEDSSSALHDEDNGGNETGAPCHTPVSHDYKETSSNDNFFRSLDIQIPQLEVGALQRKVFCEMMVAMNHVFQQDQVAAAALHVD